ncbi:MAG: hypothetical protein CL515_01825, partial [Actinobacteria bacterium]|nr:hypothetical protein [Actinomycetota bacterium]
FTIPIFDLAIVVISRISKGKSPFEGGVDHISHRLMKLGFSEKNVIGIICFLNVYTVIMIYFIVTLNQTGAFIFVALFIISFVALGAKLLKAETLD